MSTSRQSQLVNLLSLIQYYDSIIGKATRANHSLQLQSLTRSLTFKSDILGYFSTEKLIQQPTFFNSEEHQIYLIVLTIKDGVTALKSKYDLGTPILTTSDIAPFLNKQPQVRNYLAIANRTEDDNGSNTDDQNFNSGVIFAVITVGVLLYIGTR